MKATTKQTPHKKLVTEFFGWYGVAAYISSYALVSFHIFTVDNIIYQAMNLTGALGLLIVSFQKRAYQPAVSNFLWAGIALFALTKLLLSA
jgi:hypothetical protein